MSEQKTTLPISGMTCASCAMTIENALKKTEGVIDANVNLMTEKATIDFDTDKVNLDQVKKAINDTGYTVDEE